MNLTVGSKSFHLSLGFLAGIAIALFVYFNSSGGDGVDKWLANGKQEVRVIHDLVTRDAKHAAEGASARKAAAKLADSTEKVQARFQQLADTFRKHLEADAHATPQATADFLAVTQACYDALHLCKARGDSLAHADSVDNSRSDSLRQALDTANVLVAQGINAVSCHLIHAGPIKLFGCPSRRQSFELGAGVGAIIAYLLIHR